MKINSKKGFTLIELLVVIAIIGVLSTVVIVSLTSAKGKANKGATVKIMRSAMVELLNCADSGGFGWTTNNNPAATAPTPGTTYICQNTSGGANNNKAGFSALWVALEPGWSYAVPTGSLAGGDYTYTAVNGSQTITCTVATTKCN